MNGYMNRDDQHLQLSTEPEPDRVEVFCDVDLPGRPMTRPFYPSTAPTLARGWLIERTRNRKLRNEVEAERALRLDAQAELRERSKEHSKLRVLSQLAAVKYKAETEQRAAVIAKLRARYDDLRGSPHRESRGAGIAEAIEAIEGATDA